MEKATVEMYLKEKLAEYLRNIEVFETKNLADREEFTSLQQKTQMFKKDNPKGTYEDVKEELIRIQEVHYWSFLLEQNMKHELIKAKELITLSDILGVDLGFEGDKEEAVKAIRSQESDMFFVDGKGDVSLLDNEFKPQLEGAINARKADTTNLRTMFENIPLPQSV